MREGPIEEGVHLRKVSMIKVVLDPSLLWTQRRCSDASLILLTWDPSLPWTQERKALL